MPTYVYESGWKEINPGDFSVEVSGSWKSVAGFWVYSTAYTAWELVYDGTIPQLSGFSCGVGNTGTSCGAPRDYNIAWTPNGAVNNSLHYLYIEIQGTSIPQITSPVLPGLGYANNVPSYMWPGGGSVTVGFDMAYYWELRYISTDAVIQTGGPTAIEHLVGKYTDCSI